MIDGKSLGNGMNDDLKSPLIPKIKNRNQKNSSSSQKTSNSPTELKSEKSDENISSSPIQFILICLFLLVGGLNLSFYRNYINVANSATPLYQEILTFVWRNQAISIFLVLYILALKLFSLSNSEFSSFCVNLEFCEVFSTSNFLHMFLNMISNFLFLYSTKFISIGLSLIFINSFSFIQNFFKGDSSKKSLNFFCFFLFLFGVSELIISPDTQMVDYDIIRGLILCSISGLINSQIRNFNSGIFKSKTKTSIVTILYFSSAVYSLLIMIIINFISQNDITSSFGWILSVQGIYEFGLQIGGISFLYIILTLLISSKIEVIYLKSMRIIEPIANELVAILIVNLYTFSNNLNFYLGLAQIIFSIILVEFRECFKSLN